jgi:hypothetical protein
MVGLTAQKSSCIMRLQGGKRGARGKVKAQMEMNVQSRAESVRVGRAVAVTHTHTLCTHTHPHTHTHTHTHTHAHLTIPLVDNITYIILLCQLVCVPVYTCCWGLLCVCRSGRTGNGIVDRLDNRVLRSAGLAKSVCWR